MWPKEFTNFPFNVSGYDKWLKTYMLFLFTI